MDLCSGGGGPTLLLQQALAAEGVPARITLTDRYPNAAAFEQVAARSGGAISFSAQPVDARAVPDWLTGFRTMFNAFHHFAPADAVAVLRDAVAAGQPIGIFEIPDRVPGMLLPMLFLTPLIVLLFTPCIRPVTPARLLLTYLLPLVPLTCWFDGVVSQLRAYRAEELEALAQAAGAERYRWRAGHTPIGSAPGRLTYLIGYPEPD